ncbi:hypothetical protein SprV_0301343000 [Sparganum proliferum]
MVAANESNPQPKNSTTNSIPSSFKPYDGSKDFSCWLRRLKFHLDEVPQHQRSRTVLQHLADDQTDKALDAGLTRHTPFQVLCDQLQRLLQPPLSIEEATDQLLKRSLRSDETPRQFADALLRFARDAYPSLSAADRDQVVLYHFKRGLGSQEVTYSLRIQPPGDLNEAIQRASRMLTTDAPTGDNHARAESWKTNPDRRQQNNTWTRPHYPPSQRFNRGSRPSTFRTPYRPPPSQDNSGGITKEGHQHANADALSRRPSEAGTADPEVTDEHIAAVTISEPTRYHWAVAQSTDPDTAIIYDHQLHGRHRPTEVELRGSSEIARLLCHQWANLFVENELLFFKDAASTHPRLVVPSSLVLSVLTDLHHM